jgi:tetratricopeptide (TPR) repeat protein
MQSLLSGERPVVRQAEGLLTRIITWTYYALAVLVPLFFLPWTSEVLEWNKRALVMVGAAVVGLAWLGRGLVSRRMEYRHSLVTLLVGLFVAVTAASALLAPNPYFSLVGDSGQQKAALVTVLGLAVLLAVGVQVWRDPADVRKLSVAVVVGGFIAALFGFLQAWAPGGHYLLPFAFAKSSSFTTVGTFASLAAYLAFTATLAGGMLLSPHSDHACSGRWCRATNVFLFIAAVLMIFMVAVVEFTPVLIGLIAGALVLVGFAIAHAGRMRGVSGIFVPVIALIVAGITLATSFPINLKVPAELMPSLKTSAHIAWQTVQTKPIFGSGPGTFLADYARFKPREVNETQFWDVRFDRSSSRFFTILATTGIIGALSYLFLCAGVILLAVRKLRRGDEQSWHVLVGVFAGWLSLFVIRFFYSSTMTLEFAFWLATAMVVALTARGGRESSVEFDNSPRAGLSVAFAFIVAAVAATAGAAAMAFRYSAEASYAYALNLDRNGGTRDQIVGEMVKAVRGNPQSDVYLRNLAVGRLAQTNDALNEADPAKKEGEKDADYRQRLEEARQARIRRAGAYAEQSIRLANEATRVDPTMPANWIALASIYQNLSGFTTGAADESIKAFQKAMEIDPSNPAIPTEIGKLYLAQSDAARADLASKDQAVKDAAQTKVNDLLAKAMEQFNAAVALKSDYAPAHYQIALALDRQDKLKEAIAKMESVTKYNPNDVGVAFQLSLLYYRDGRKDEALRWMQALVRFAPNFSNARWYLASMLEEKNDLDGAIAQLEEVAKLAPGNTAVQERLSAVKAKKAGTPTPKPSDLPQPVDTVQPKVGQ